VLLVLVFGRIYLIILLILIFIKYDIYQCGKIFVKDNIINILCKVKQIQRKETKKKKGKKSDI